MLQNVATNVSVCTALMNSTQVMEKRGNLSKKKILLNNEAPRAQLETPMCSQLFSPRTVVASLLPIKPGVYY